MSDDVDTIRAGLLKTASHYMHWKDGPAGERCPACEGDWRLRTAALAALGRVVAERDELRARLQQLDAWASRMPDAGFTSEDPRWQWWHERPRLGQALGGASGASSTAAELTPERRIEGLRNLRNGYGTVSAAVGFWKSLHDEDLIEVYAELAEVSGGTSTGSARPPQPESETDALVRERLRMHAERQRAEAAEARVVRLEEALRARDERDEWLRKQLAGCAEDAYTVAEVVGLALARSVARNIDNAVAALVGDAPPPNTKTGAGAPPAHVETGGPSGDSEDA